MYQKNCDRCYRPSFSSSEKGEWLCPACGNDLTSHDFFDAMTLDRVNIRLHAVKTKDMQIDKTSYTGKSLHTHRVNVII